MADLDAQAQDQRRIAELAAGIDLSRTLSLVEFGEGRRRRFSRTLDEAVAALQQSAARQAADSASRLAADFIQQPAPQPKRRGLFPRPGKRKQTPKTPPLTPQGVQRLATALKVRQAALLKESLVLERLSQQLAGIAHELGLYAEAARLRAQSAPDHASDLQARAMQLDLTKLAAEQTLAAITMVRHADDVSTEALRGVVTWVVPAWERLASAVPNNRSTVGGIEEPASGNNSQHDPVALLQSFRDAEQSSADAVEQATRQLATVPEPH